jgi:hypothetical protein
MQYVLSAQSALRRIYDGQGPFSILRYWPGLATHVRAEAPPCLTARRCGHGGWWWLCLVAWWLGALWKPDGGPEYYYCTLCIVLLQSVFVVVVVVVVVVVR